MVYGLSDEVFVETARHDADTQARLDAGPAEITLDPGNLSA